MDIVKRPVYPHVFVFKFEYFANSLPLGAKMGGVDALIFCLPCFIPMGLNVPS